MQHVSDLHPKFALRLTPCVESMVNIQSATAGNRRGKTMEEGKKKKKEYTAGPLDKNIMSASATQGGHNAAD